MQFNYFSSSISASRKRLLATYKIAVSIECFLFIRAELTVRKYTPLTAFRGVVTRV
jgi:hypothetical protein